MGKVVRKMKWHWFINPLIITTISNALGTCDFYFIGPGTINFYLSPYVKFVVLSLIVVWFLIVFYGGKEAFPSLYFLAFSFILMFLELAFSAILDYLNVGGFKNFSHI